MPRLRNTVTGVVVSVSDDTAARLGREWRPADSAPKPQASRPPRRRTPKPAGE
ncbi:hypothetical protein IU501_10890 [Nocardia otitidiscaviarum]|uniref:DUF7302 family protein n=1 Tax=Nocardia otitidiscaviarum TaxID=1823 RepID=UPI001893B756|nr:hypothetical protein [Nocardia otitidiscaviarum]MBF6133505.1 hypothetical protein [Nocardia otitidiscaviarum]